LIEVEVEVPVTVLKTIRKTIEVETEIPVTELKQITTMVPVTTEVPVQSIKHVRTSIPVETTVPFTTKKQVSANISVDSTVPIPGKKTVEALIPIESTIPTEGQHRINTSNIPLHTNVSVESTYETVKALNVQTKGISHLSDSLNLRSTEGILAETRNMSSSGQSYDRDMTRTSNLSGEQYGHEKGKHYGGQDNRKFEKDLHHGSGLHGQDLSKDQDMKKLQHINPSDKTAKVIG